MEQFEIRFLNYLEKKEEQLLAWGFYDSCFSVSEIEQFVIETPELAEGWRDFQEDWTIDEFVNELVRCNLLYKVNVTGNRVRSRFAETVRLIARLRQIFNEKQWQSGANLVSDIKFNLKSRKYPKRDQSAKCCWEAMQSYATQSALQKKLFECLAQDNATKQSFSFSGFQKRSFEHIFSKYRSAGASGSVVCAGTGAGKTKAFYVPAIVAAAEEIDETPFTKIIAVYPRNVLLADQLREAVSEALKLNETLVDAGKRPLTLGALLGQTPWNGSTSFESQSNKKSPAEKWNGWQSVGDGFALPFLKSPLDPSADLVWRDVDRKAGKTCLYRVGCDTNEPDIPDKMLLLTREALRESPPDILFLSAEMLNRELGNPEWAKTFGIREKTRRPRLLLLDEVHSYEGLSGAQHAWLFRRWRHAVRGGARYAEKSESLHVVALSATLKDAAAHVSRVVGLKAEDVVDFRPLAAEYEQESQEYNLAIKGDPSEGTSLLSTTIQTGMLLGRSLTPRTSIPQTSDLNVASEKMFGNKVFGFTDNLDSINRWFSDMTDAEQGRRLASYRKDPSDNDPAPDNEEMRLRNTLGQIWNLPDKLGYNLDQPLQIGRCSSQDPGVGQNVDLIIATSALEVGFDDPSVGAVMQHKNPGSMASFIQRKGRAGRSRGSRPWTLIVLSDYGKDRYAFQHAEKLFEPEIDSIALPYHNQFVLRTQATFFLIDWLGKRIKRGSSWKFLSGRTDSDYLKRSQLEAISILEDFLQQGKEWESFHQEVMKLFSHRTYGPDGDLSKDQVECLFWEQPRPLLLEVVPMLLRQLESGWRIENPQKSEDDFENQGITRPLPGFLPSALYESLDIAEARIAFPPTTSKEDEYLDVSRVLTEECPGNISKRYATGNQELGYWHAYSVNLAPGSNQATVSQLYGDVVDLGLVHSTRVLQPNLVEVVNHPPDILDTSSAQWDWGSAFQPAGRGYEIPVFKALPWKDIVQSCEAFLHRDQSGVIVTRYASSLQFELRRRDGRSDLGNLELVAGPDSDQRSEAVGFQRKVDGIAIHLNESHLQNMPELPSHLLARFRTDYYKYQLLKSERIPTDINMFQRDWLWHTSLGMLTATALQNECSLEKAQKLLKTCRAQAADRILGSIFQIREDTQGDSQGRTAQNLRDLWQDESLVKEIEQLETLLWRELDDDFYQWVRQRYIATLAHAFRVTATSFDSQVNESDISIDVVSDDAGGAVIYLTETQSGGLGVIEKILQNINKDPARFHNGMLYSLSNCQRQRTADYLNAVLDTLSKEDDLRAIVHQLRNAQSFSENEDARRMLQEGLVDFGYGVTRDRFVSLMMHVFAPGSSPQTDAIAKSINADWHNVEENLQVGIDSRVFAYCSLAKDKYRTAMDAHLNSLQEGALVTDHQRYTALERFLYPTCHDSCPECLGQKNWYRDFGTPSRELGLLWLGVKEQRIVVEDARDEWVPRVRETILATGVVEVVFTESISDLVIRQLHELFSQEVEDDSLFYPISMQSAEKDGNAWVLKLAIKDIVHA